MRPNRKEIAGFFVLACLVSALTAASSTAVYTGQAGEWNEGLTSAVSWDDVTAFHIFTREQFAEKMTDPRS